MQAFWGAVSNKQLMCATSLGKLCASDHAMNAIDEMSALNRDLKKFFVSMVQLQTVNQGWSLVKT